MKEVTSNITLNLLSLLIKLIISTFWKRSNSAAWLNLDDSDSKLRSARQQDPLNAQAANRWRIHQASLTLLLSRPGWKKPIFSQSKTGKSHQECRFSMVFQWLPCKWLVFRVFWGSPCFTSAIPYHQIRTTYEAPFLWKALWCHANNEESDRPVIFVYLCLLGGSSHLVSGL